MQQTILHIDFDSFFASVAQQEHPEYRKRPLGVTATHGRNCIIASSREAKRLGIGTASRVHDAKRICPNIILVPADFVKYWEISKQFITICKDYSPYVEVFSIDELFMDVTLSAHLFGGVEQMVLAMKRRIAKEIGEYITISVGVSHNKLLAKLASGMKKPDGLVVIKPTQVEAYYRVAKLTDMCGIGERIKRRLNQMGIFTLIHLRNAPLSSLIAEFGNVEGHFLHNVGQGIDNGMVKPFSHADTVKSIGRNYCLPENIYDKRIVLQNLYELCEEVSIKLRRLNKKARTVGFCLRGTYILTGRKTFGMHFETGRDLYYACMSLLDEELFRTGYTRQISIWVSSLSDSSTIPQSLLLDQVRFEKLTKVMDKINDTYGHHTIRNGFLLYADKLTTVPNGFMADKFERFQLANDKTMIENSEPWQYTKDVE